MLRSVEVRAMGEEGSSSECSCSCSKELVVGDGDMGGVRSPLSGAMFMMMEKCLAAKMRCIGGKNVREHLVALKNDSY